MFQQIARETEEDFEYLIQTLKKFNVEIVRPNVPAVQIDEYLTSNNRIPGPISMVPRDQMIMIGNKFLYTLILTYQLRHQAGILTQQIGQLMYTIH